MASQEESQQEKSPKTHKYPRPWIFRVFDKLGLDKLAHFVTKSLCKIAIYITERLCNDTKQDNKESEERSTKTFNDDFDNLNLKPFAERLFNDIKRGIEENTEEAYTISLDAGFGRGKTTFLEMFENMVKDEKKDYGIFQLNSWTTEFYDNPTVTILAEFVNFLETEGEKEKSRIVYQGLKSFATDVLASISVNIGVPGFGVSIDSSKFLDSKHKRKMGDEMIEKYKQQQGSVKQIKSVISKYEEIAGKKLIILIDELDRVKPDYAVHFLETVKHFFDIPGVCFLFAVNRQQIETTAKNLFGDGLEFVGYYDKFFRREFSLTNAYSQAVRDFIKGEIEKLEKKRKEKTLTSFFDTQQHQDIWVGLSQTFNLSLRQIEDWIKQTNSNYMSYEKKLLDPNKILRNIKDCLESLPGLGMDGPKIKEVHRSMESRCDEIQKVLASNEEDKYHSLRASLRGNYDFYVILFYTGYYIKHKEEYEAIALQGMPDLYERISSYVRKFATTSAYLQTPIIEMYLYFSLHQKTDLLTGLVNWVNNRGYDWSNGSHRFKSSIPNLYELKNLTIYREDLSLSQHPDQIIAGVLQKCVENDINFSTLYNIISAP